MPRCAAKSSRTGLKCKHQAKDGEIYCTTHLKGDTGSQLTEGNTTNNTKSNKSGGGDESNDTNSHINSARLAEQEGEVEDINFMLRAPDANMDIENAPELKKRKTIKINRKRDDDIGVLKNRNLNESEELEYLRNENKILFDMVKSLTKHIRNLKVVQSVVTGKKPRKRSVTDKMILKEAKWMFYNDHKEDADIQTEIKTRIASSGLPSSVAPWQFVKFGTDVKFDRLSQDEKNMVMEKAKRNMCARV
jgi:hypothetical protein